MVSKLNLEKIKELIKSDDNYQHFKLIAGFFNRKDLGNLNEIEESRTKEIELYVNYLTDKNKEEYINLILQVNKLFFDKNIYLFSFKIFIKQICLKSPELIYDLLATKQNELKQEIIQILSDELFKSSLKDKMLNILKEWVQNNKYLYISLKTLLTDKIPDLKIIEMIVHKACINSESKFLNETAKELFNIPEAKHLFLTVLQKLTEIENAEWLTNSYFQDFSIIENINKEEIILLLKNLEFVSYIDYSVEKLLSKISKNYSKEIMFFFYSRIKKKNMTDIFNNFDELAISLGNKEKIVVDEILNWDEAYFNLSSELLHALIPLIDNYLKTKLEELIHNGEEKDIKKAIRILESYNLNDSVRNICKEIIIKFYPKYKDYLFEILSKTGVVLGWNGYSTAYQKKKEEISIWENEQNSNIKSFVKDYEKYLNKKITFHKKDEKDEIKSIELDFNS